MRFISCLIVLLCSAVLTAQDREGMILSNYHPVTGTYFNPSASVDSRAFVQANLVGIPAISLPMGTKSTGMPFGIQLMGGMFKEKDLLAFSQYMMSL